MDCYSVKRVALYALMMATCASAVAEQPKDRARAGKKEAEQTGPFIRVAREGKQPVALETAIVRCAPADRGREAPTVDLVAAVHVGEKSYYQQLNRQFAAYDAVLYELVAPEGTKIPKGGARPSGNPVSLLQNGMKDLLELEFQLNHIDYTRKNMVHADMSPEQFAKSMRVRGESAWTMFLRVLGYAMARQNQANDTVTEVQLLIALLDKNRAMALKRILAEQFVDMEGTLSPFDGPEGSTIITERNKVALEVLRKQIAAGKRKIAIFYGAGHLADLQRRLQKDFGLTPVNTRWLTAWNLK